MSTSARHGLYFIPEVTYGVTPANPAFDFFRHTGTTLGVTKSTHISEELRADRQIADFRHGTKQTGGDVSFELSYGSFDTALQAVLGGTWAAKHAPYAASTISALASDNSINDSANGFPVLEAGDKISLAGFTGEVGNNQVGTVVSRTAGKIVLTTATPLVDDIEGEAVTVTTLTQRLTAGVERRSFTVLRHFSDIAEAGKPYHLFPGTEFNTLSLTVPTDGIVTGSLAVVGKELTLSGTLPAGGSLGPAPTTRVMDTFTGTLEEGGEAIAIATEVTLTLENGMEPRFAIGSDATVGTATVGRVNLSGQVTAYFENATMLEKFLNETGSSLKLTLRDRAGNAYRITIPNIVYNGGQPDTQGQGEITLAIPFQAILDSTLGSNLAIDRIAA